MPINIEFDGDLVILSNFGRLLNDPRYLDASRDVRVLLDEGRRNFVLDLSSLREVGSAGLGLLMTISRLIRQHGGEVVLAKVGSDLMRLLDEMRMDSYWEIFDDLETAKAYFQVGEADEERT